MTQTQTRDNETSPQLMDLIDHFQKLYNKHDSDSLQSQTTLNSNRSHTPLPNLNKLNQEITYNEVKTSLRKLKANKAPGFDRITNSMLKATDSVIDIFKELFNKILNTGIFPEQWNHSLIKTLFKSGNKDNPNDYRGISLNNTIGKVFCSILHDRLLDCCEENKILKDEQAAFRKNYRTTDHIYLLKHIIKKYTSENKKLYTCFVDLTKAFDSVWRKGLLNKIKQIGITGKIYNIIEYIYSNTTYSLIQNNKVTKPYINHEGIKQGDNLSTLLFNFYLNDIPQYLNKQYTDPIHINDSKMNTMMFADDLLLLSTSANGLQNNINILTEYCEKWKLKINIKKTKIMTFSKSGNIDNNKYKLMENDIEHVKEYKYLGFVFTSNGSMTTGINRLCKQGEKAWFAIQKYIGGLKQKNIHVWIKLFDALVKPIILYACEAWGNDISGKFNNIQTIFRDSFERLHIKICKQILGTHRKTTNIPVLAELGRFPMKLNIDIQMIKYFLRLGKIQEDRFLHKIYTENNRKCENKKDWNYHIKEILNQCGLSYIWRNQLNKITQTYTDSSINKTISTRMKDIFSQNALAFINKDKNKNCGKMDFLSQIKDIYAFEPYLNIKNDNHRKSLTKLRLSSHKLEIEVGRWNKVKREERVCKFCQLGKVENESHFLFECPKYTLKRITLYQFINEKLNIDMQIEQDQLKNLQLLFTMGELSTMNALGKYIYECFEERH